jgi:hypothetical protein
MSENHAESNRSIGIVVAIITAIGVLVAAALTYLGTRYQTDRPISATQTAEARLTALAGFSTPTFDPKMMSTVTPTLTSAPRHILRANCIDSDYWTPYQVTVRIPDEDDCWQLMDWGLSARDDGLLIFVENASQGVRRGISTPISANSRVDLDIKIDRLETPEYDVLANVAIGVIPANPIEPESGGLLFYQVEAPLTADWPVFLKQRERGTAEDYLGLRYAYGTTQHITFLIQGVQLTIFIDEVQVSEPINVLFTNRAFWVGYLLPQSGGIYASLTNLSIREE